MHMNRTCITFAVLVAVAGCGGGKSPPPNVRGCWGDDCAIIATSHYNADYTGVGTLNAVELSKQKIVKNLDASLDPDVAMSIENGKLYVLNRDTAGSLRRYDLATFTVEHEIATGTHEAPNTASAPFAFWRDGKGKVYVSLAGNDAAHAVGVLDESQPDAGVVKYIAVPAAATDPDGKPEVAAVHACDGTLYVLTQDYTLSGNSIVYNAPGRIAVIDLASATTVGFIALTGKNPAAIAAEGSDCGQVLVATSSDLTSSPDGTAGLERVDLRARMSKGFVAADTAIAGRPYSIAVVSPTLAFVGMYFDPQPDATGKIVLGSAKVVAWNPKTGAVTGDVTGKAGFINFVARGGDGKLYVAVGTFAGAPEPGKLAQGLYVGPADGSRLPATPIDLGDTPSAIAFQNP
jgi:hypothetical protein